jgi:hypothetical protein
VKTKTAPAVAPADPTIGTDENNPTSNSITISKVCGCEYYISISSAADWSGTPNGYFKAADNGMHKFDNLTPATKYYIHVRVAETADAMPSASKNVLQYTLPVTPDASVVTINYAQETISFGDIYEVSTAQTGGSEISNNGSIRSIIGSTAQTIYVRIKAISGGAPASEWGEVTVPTRPEAPIAPVVSAKTDTSITITAVSGQEYSKDNGISWRDGGEFAGLSANTPYTILTRLKAGVDSGSESFASASSSLAVTTKASAPAATTYTIDYVGEPQAKLFRQRWNTTPPLQHIPVYGLAEQAKTWR